MTTEPDLAQCPYCYGRVPADDLGRHLVACPDVTPPGDTYRPDHAAAIAAPARRTRAQAAATNAILEAMGSGLRVPTTEPDADVGHPIDATLVQLAGALQDNDEHDDEVTMLYIVQLLASLMAPPIHAELCRLLDICPTHLRDAEICADDMVSDCDAGQAAIDSWNRAEAARAPAADRGDQ